MSQKHFIALADALRVSKPIPRVFEVRESFMVAFEQWIKTRDQLAYTLGVMNPNFDHERWVAYTNKEAA